MISGKDILDWIGPCHYIIFPVSFFLLFKRFFRNKKMIEKHLNETYTEEEIKAIKGYPR